MDDLSTVSSGHSLNLYILEIVEFLRATVRENNALLSPTIHGTMYKLPSLTL